MSTTDDTGDQEHSCGDYCQPVEVDGEIIMVLGAEHMDDTDRAAFAELVRLCKRRHAAKHGDRAPDTQP